MKVPSVGRRTSSSAPPPTPVPEEKDGIAQGSRSADPRQSETGDALKSPSKVAWELLDHLAREMTKNGKIRSIDMFAALGSIGGFSCVVAALEIASSGELRDDADLIAVEATDGSRYYTGNLPNTFLLESHDSLLNRTYGAARKSGALIPQDTVTETLHYVISTIGLPEFGIPRLADEHRPGDTPLAYVQHLWPKAADVLDRNLVPVRRQTLAIGMAVELAFVYARPQLDPALAARIVTECAIPMAKLDPRLIG